MRRERRAMQRRKIVVARIYKSERRPFRKYLLENITPKLYDLLDVCRSTLLIRRIKLAMRAYAFMCFISEEGIILGSVNLELRI